MSRRKRYTRNLGRSLPEPLPVRTTAEWVRFEHAREPYGVFCYLPDVRSAHIPIVERRIRRVPGVVRFQDREQVAVLTFRDTPRVSRVRTIASCR